MTEQDRAGIPAKESDFRAVRTTPSRDVIYLQAPEYIRYFPDYRLEKKNDDGTWSTFLLPESDVESPSENE